MLRLIIGRARSGKTSYIKNIIAQRVREEKRVTLIVPEQFSLESERTVIELLGNKKAAEVKLYSFSSLSKNILGEYGKKQKPYITDAAKCVIMSMALEALDDRLEIFSGSAKNRKTVSELLHTADEMIQSDLSAAEVCKAARASGNELLIKKTAEIELICGMYETLLAERFSDDRYIINAAARIADEKKLFAGETVIFDEFTGFTSQENLLVIAALSQAEEVFVTQCADGIHDDSDGSGAFSYASDNINRLIALANKSGAAVAQPVITKRDNRYSSKALECLENGVYAPSPEIYGDDAPEITVAAAENPYDECDFAAMSAKRLVRETGIRYRDIVIVFRNSDYEKYLPFSLKKYSIPVFEDRRRKLENELIVVFALGCLTLAADGFTTDRVLQCLKTSLFGISGDETALIENYVLMWQIDGASWLREWTGHPDGFGYELDGGAKERLSKINRLREEVVNPVMRLREELNDKDGYGCTEALYNFLIRVRANENLLSFALELDGERGCDCERSWDEFMNALSLLADTVGTRNVSPQRYLELLRITVSSYEIGDIPDGLDQITIGDADRIRVSDKKVMFTVGANEGVFPAESKGSFIITDSERRLLSEEGARLGSDSYERMKKERLRVYGAVSIPSDRLFVSYSMSDFKGGSLSPSEIVSMVQKIVPKHNSVDISALEPIDKVESFASAFESAATHFSDNTVYSESVKSFAGENPDYGDLLSAVSLSADKTPMRIVKKENAELLFPKNMFISPSKVEEYYKCPFKYFCSHGLNAYPIRKAAFDQKQNGTLVHFVLEKLFSRYGSSVLRSLSDEERRNAVREETENYISSFISVDGEISERLKYSLERAESTVCEILERLASEFTGSKFETRDVELSIDFDGDIKPYTVDVPDGGKVFLNGIIDRVDAMEAPGGDKTYIRVIDYKTGGRDFRLEDIMSGLNIQMLLYLICLCRNGRDRYGNTVPAGVLYVPAKKGKNTLGRDADEEQIAKAKIAGGKMSGPVLSDPEVIYGMEESGGGFIIDARIDKNGVIKGKTFDMHEFSLLEKQVNNVVSDMASSLHSGNIEAVPMLDGSYKRTCEFCDYKSVCRREDSDEYRTLFKGNIWEALEETGDE